MTSRHTDDKAEFPVTAEAGFGFIEVGGTGIGPEEALSDRGTGRTDRVDGVQKQAENMIARYFGDVRQFALLSRAEEQALWTRIEQCKARWRRALYTSPVALPTLTRIWRQVEAGDLPLQQVVDADGAADQQHTHAKAKLEATIVALENLHADMQELRLLRQTPARSASERRRRRQEWARLWRQWIAVWEALRPRTAVHDAIRFALKTDLQAQPGRAALRAAHAAWLQARRRRSEAEARMLRANLRLVIHVANRYRGRGVPLLDLIQEGNIGLMRALEKFEPQRGLKFVTYAHWWVRQAISRSLMEQYRTVRLPVYVVERKNKLQSVSDRLWDSNGQEPSIQELSDAIGWTPQEVADTRAAGQPMARLHTPMTDDGKILADILEDTDSPPLEAGQAEKELRHFLADCLAHLTAREAFILRLRYGLETTGPHTLQEIADRLGLSRERVRQVENKALEKLRQSHYRELLADFVGV